MNILITEPKDYSPKALAIYKKLGRVYFCTPVEALKKMEPKFLADVLVVRLKYAIDKSWMDKMPNLKVIATPTTGLNHIDVGYAESKNISVISLRGETSFLKNITSTAELALGLMLALSRRVPAAFESVKKGGWDRMSFRGRQLYGQTLGIVGYGRLGRIMARYGRALGMRVIARDPYVKSAGVKLVGLDKLFKLSDVVSLHVLLTEKNYGLIKKKHFRLMKPAALFVNTARAELVEPGALEKALKNKWIAGAAVDVMRDEKGDGSHLKNNPLLRYAMTHDNLLIVPHIGGATFEAMHITEDFIAARVKKYISSKKLR